MAVGVAPGSAAFGRQQESVCERVWKAALPGGFVPVPRVPAGCAGVRVMARSGLTWCGEH